MELFKSKANAFLSSYYYPLLVLFATLISHTFSIEPLGFSIILVTAGTGLLICDDFRFIISPLIMFIFMFSDKSVKSGIFYTTPYLVAIGVVSFAVIFLFVLRFIKYKGYIDIKAPLKSKLFIGIACLCGSFFLNGLFNFDGYRPENLIFAISLTVCIGLVFFLFSTNLKPSGDIKNYFFYVLFLTSILIALEFYLSFIYQFEFADGQLVKESILLGWGIWNNVGGMLAFLLPVHFYFASTAKKYGWAFYLSGIFIYLTIVLSLSRSSLLISTITIIVCAIVSCFKGENKKTNRIITCAIGVVGIVGVIVLWDKLYSVLGDYFARGFDDNGRFEIYKKGIDNFCDNPIFGGGFFSADAQDYQFVAFMPDRYHNTIIQMLGTCGIVGLLAYAYHRYETIRLFWKKRSLYTAFCILCMAGFLGTSLLDNHFFNMYPSFIYVIMLVVVEISQDDFTLIKSK